MSRKKRPPHKAEPPKNSISAKITNAIDDCGGEFYFDAEAADRVVSFFETCLTHVKGKKKGQPLLLDDWQKYILRTLFGWKVIETGLRRFNVLYLEVPRKNGKALAIDTPVATPAGFASHGRLRPGSDVLNAAGAPVKVRAITPHYDGPCYRVTFSNGPAIIAHEAHEWIVDQSPVPVETAQIAMMKKHGFPVTISRPAGAKVRITGVSPVGIRKVNCIEVEGGIYLVGAAQIPTHNSTLAAGIALYLFLADKEPGSEVYSAASDKDQARIVFNVAKQMVIQSPKLRQRAEIYKNSMAHLSSASSYIVLSADADTKDGLNAHGIVVDEVHAQKKRDLIDVLKTSTGAREQPLEVYITTAGFDRHSICYEMHDYAEKVRDGIITDHQFLAVIFAAAKDDDWTDPGTWAKANPGLGISVALKYFHTQCNRAKETPGYENTFKRLHLNIWTEQHTRWLPKELWDSCALGAIRAQLKGRKVFAGLDLSSTKDVTALVLLVLDPDGITYDVVPFFWIPEENIAKRVERDRVDYDVWHRQGFLLTTPGNVVDQEFIRTSINALATEFHFQEIAIDRWNAAKLQTELMADGFTVVPFGQGFASMAAPTAELERLLLAGLIRHGGHPVLRWMSQNVATTQDAAGNMKPDKSKSTDRIDGIVALIMAIGRATVNQAGGSIDGWLKNPVIV